MSTKYLDIYMEQVKDISIKFDTFFEKNKFNTIIEIGTCHGGLSMYLALAANAMGAKFFTFDIVNDLKKPHLLEALNGTFFQLDVFKNKAIKIITHRLNEENNRVLLLCDGGKKIKEFNLYAQYLKPSDVIMAHDYFTSMKKFHHQHKQPVWKCCEITLNDIKESLLKYNILSYHPEFEDSFWFCGKRVKEKI